MSKEQTGLWARMEEMQNGAGEMKVALMQALQRNLKKHFNAQWIEIITIIKCDLGMFFLTWCGPGIRRVISALWTEKFKIKSREKNWGAKFEIWKLILSLVSLSIRSTTKGDNERVAVRHASAKCGADLLAGSSIIGPISALKLC